MAEPKDSMDNDKITLKLSMVTTPGALPVPAYGSKESLLQTRFCTLWAFIARFLVLAAVIGLSIACYFVVSRYFIHAIQVVGEIMTPTLASNNHYLLNRWAFHSREPKAGEVVVLSDPEDHGYSVKRIVATGGQAVLIKEGKVFVDGVELDEPYLVPNTLTFTYSTAKEQLITCGKEQYFVMGDNRLRSIDSRV